ncbi:MAG: terminase [Aestuariivirga sp.]|nr:terminase [Aestuariivirga sp.]
MNKADSALTPAIIAQWSDRKWRLNNLYWITDKHGAVIKFNLNPAQEKLLTDLHYLNVVLKARQLGFSTLILLMALDCCLFNGNFSAGLIADTLPNAKHLLTRVKFAYERLPDQLKAKLAVITDNTEEITFANGSEIRVGTSLRSGTYNFIHISEYGKICAKDPGKADEIKTGALNTLAPRQLCFIESTAEGRSGDFYDKSSAAQKIHDAGREPGEIEYKFHFFPWFQDAAYSLEQPYNLTPENISYFAELKDLGITLTDGQKWWYAAKQREQGDGMWKEFPSTPDEAFKAAKDGAYFAKDIQNLRVRKKIGQFEFETNAVVSTFWDIGTHDMTSIWLHQFIKDKHRFVGFYESSGEGIGYYLDWLDKWRARRSAKFGEHYGPHDIENRFSGEDGHLTSYKDIAKKLGFTFRTVKRTPDKLNSIQAVRSILPMCEFDELECEVGLVHLENYSRDWDETFGVWKPHPRKDGHDHGADAFMQFADGYTPPVIRKKLEYPKNDGIV